MAEAGFEPGQAGSRPPALSQIIVLDCTVCLSLKVNKDFLVAQMVKNLPTMQVTCVWALGREDPLEKGMATHSSILA